MILDKRAFAPFAQGIVRLYHSIDLIAKLTMKVAIRALERIWLLESSGLSQRCWSMILQSILREVKRGLTSRRI